MKENGSSGYFKMKINKAIITLLVIFAIWSIISLFQFLKPVFLPSPMEIVLSFMQLVKSQLFYKHIFYSLWRAFVSFIFASILGVSIGLLLGYFIGIKEYFESLIDFLRTMPSPALIPLSLVIFGIGDLAKIVVVTFSISLIIIVNTIYGVQSVKKTRKNVFKSLRANKAQTFTKLIVPEAMPHIISGLRTSLSLTLIIVVVTEMLIGTHFGLGYAIQTEQLLYNIPEMYCYIIILGILGYLLNKLVLSFEKRILFWTSE